MLNSSGLLLIAAVRKGCRLSPLRRCPLDFHAVLAMFDSCRAQEFHGSFLSPRAA